jgi:hypothetical protein
MDGPAIDDQVSSFAIDDQVSRIDMVWSKRLADRDFTIDDQVVYLHQRPALPPARVEA